MKPIHVFDSLLSKESLSGVQNFFASSIKWRYGWPQGTKDPFSHWSHDFLGAALANQENLEEKLCGILTERQKGILRLIRGGFSNAAISQELRISEGTVKQHLHNLFCRLGVSSRTQAIAAVARRGLLKKE